MDYGILRTLGEIIERNKLAKYCTALYNLSQECREIL
jgi:hypothetical protein